MLTYNNETGTISMVAKDTGDFVVSISNYQLDTGDKVYFTINNALEKQQALVQKVITTFTDNNAIIHLTKEDTNLEVGTYFYDIQLNTADGRVDTIVGPHKFKITGGVTY